MGKMWSCEKGKNTCLTRLARPVSIIQVESQVRESDSNMQPNLFQHTLDGHLVLEPAVKNLVSVPNVYKMGSHICGMPHCVPSTGSCPSFPDLDGS